MNPLVLFVKEVVDPYVQENFRRLQLAIRSIGLIRSDLRFFELSIPKNGANLNYAHNLGYQPSDLIQTSLKGTGTLTWNYDAFDSTNLVYTAASIPDGGTLTVRFFLGSYREDTNA